MQLLLFINEILQIVIWIVCLIPQLRHSYIIKQVGLSYTYIAMFTISSLYQLIATILNNQTKFYIVNAFIVSLMFIALNVQYFLYYKNKQRKLQIQVFQLLKINSFEISVYIIIFTKILLAFHIYYILAKHDEISVMQSCDNDISNTNQNLYQLISQFTVIIIQLIAYPSQIIHNFKNKQATGISVMYIIFSLTINILHFIHCLLLTLLLKNWIQNISILFGSLIPLLFNVVLLAQFRLYKRYYILNLTKKGHLALNVFENQNQ